ncbi:MAG: hypothetical protein RBG1_1C00001G0605 [candidate division Zixibacteria bacterium RBG-1]|nr:MAG: hypothetical protein RBG1_1C00001G0605 [candidate division Zixibacteria bacterium RBG-1]OGC85845.1 MAG: hypothetical protein A2V73_07760 [candidate division Zixibacteria bacterium RBG_19FT_COMBO_42_43]
MLGSLYLSFGADLRTFGIPLFYAPLLNNYNIYIGNVKAVNPLFSYKNLVKACCQTLDALNFW